MLSMFESIQSVKNKQVKILDLVQKFKSTICNEDKKFNSVLTLNDSADAEARELDLKLENNPHAFELAGVILTIKDLICTKGLKTTAASKILSEYIPPFSATLVNKLKDKGAIIIGKTNLDEFAMGSSNENSSFGLVRNPWNLEYVPGGSSGGSAASVVAGFCHASIGTDTGGSVRQPGHFCNLVGVKPTYSRISRYGIIAFASSLDQAGPLTRKVEDAALLCEVMSGQDPMDSTTSSMAAPQWSKNLNADLKGIKIATLKEFDDIEVDPAVLEAVTNSKNILKDAGAEFVEVSIPSLKYVLSIYYLIATSEASSNLSRYDGVRFGHRSDFSKKPAKNLEEFYSKTRGEGFGDEVKRRILLGTFCLSSGYFDQYYNKACQVRRKLQEEFNLAYKSCNVILSPTASTSAFKINQKTNDPLSMYKNDFFTTAANLIGHPAISVPCLISEQGLPVGVQIMAPAFHEQVMFNTALAIENINQVFKRTPL